MDFDQVLPVVGEFGRYQKLILWFILLPSVFPCGFSAYNQLFMTAVPDHWCKLPVINGITNQLMKNISIPIETRMNTQKFSQCLMYDNLNYSVILMKQIQNFEVDQINRSSLSSSSSCQNGWTYDTDDIRRSVVSEWDLVCSKSIVPTVALVLFGFSGLMGNYIFGYIQDRLGRKPSYYIYLLIQCVFGIGTIFVENFYLWIAFRMGVGLTVPAILGTAYVLAIELVGPKDRATVMILINIAYSLSLVALAIVVWAIRDWRQLALATSAPFALLFFTWFLLPESPRWLIARGKHKEAEEILKTIAK